ncbi:hypothetical protein L596_017922 [Steinernema carpocapsae]|uniref:7TM GPCR serpentine receptor class x (Srx) domain-containing protein n=1 Tax=Steinernema carpocapsae TaxID=34508 RepID=A0A4V6A1W9_STECR|nr:hypothetical protein L596_017922 [Steinernema carpocapsae]
MIYNPNHQCCFECMHVKTGALLIALFSLVEGISNIACNVIIYGKLIVLGVFGITMTIIGIICTLLILYGLRAKNPNMLKPFMIFHIFSIVLNLFGSIMFFVGIFYAEWIVDILGELLFTLVFAALGPRTINQKVAIVQNLMITFAIINLIHIFISLWFLRVVHRCQRFMKNHPEVKSTGSIISS